MMPTIYLWNDDGNWYWDDAEDHGGFDRNVPSGPFDAELAALEDAASSFNTPASEFDEIIKDEQPPRYEKSVSLYTALVGADFSHYGTVTVEATSDEEAIAYVTKMYEQGDVNLNDVQHSGAQFPRIVTLDKGDECVTEGVDLDITIAIHDPNNPSSVYDNAPALLEALNYYLQASEHVREMGGGWSMDQVNNFLGGAAAKARAAIALTEGKD